jgi:hypothetical protein
MSLEDDLLNLREAAETAGVSEMTIRKYLGLTKPPKPSRLPNARKVMREGDTQETWSIPLSDLFNAGLMKGKTKTTSSAEQPEPELAETLAGLRAENQGLKIQVSLLERNLEDLREEIRFSRRAIETAEVQNTRRRFWQR